MLNAHRQPSRNLEDVEVIIFKDKRGFTLLELMTTVAVAGVVLSLGVPNFMGLIENTVETKPRHTFPLKQRLLSFFVNSHHGETIADRSKSTSTDRLS